MSQRLSNCLGGHWQAFNGTSIHWFDPVLGTELVRVNATGLDLAAGFTFACEQHPAVLECAVIGRKDEESLPLPLRWRRPGYCAAAGQPRSRLSRCYSEKNE